MTNASFTAILCLICGIPLSFSFLSESLHASFRHQPTTHAPSHCVLNSISSQTENGANLSAIENFLSVCSGCNEQRPDSVRIISRKSSHEPPNLIVTESVFNSVDNSAVYIALTSNFDGVDETKLKSAIGEELTRTAPREISSLLGVPSTAVPPFGHTLKCNPTVIIDESLVDQCKTSNAMIVGNAVHPYWQCLVTCDALLSLPDVQVADIICGIHQVDTAVLPESSTTTSASTSLPSADPPKPAEQSFPGYFPGNLPPPNIAKLVVEQRSLSNPLVPTTIKAIIGSLGKLEKKTKKLVTANLFPLGIDGEVLEESSLLPWRLSSDGEPFSVRLIFGRALFQALGKSQWDVILESLESGQVVEMTAQTRVIDRDSLCKWVEDQCLELEVREFRILSASSDDGKNAHDRADTGQMQFKHKPKSNWTTPQFAPVTMEDIFGQAHAGSIEFVDSVESLQSFVTETAGLLSLPISSPGENIITGPASLMGIDCEWQPNQLSARGEKQPVLLLQISLHALQKVYLLDLQTLLRPLLEPNEPMNEMEVSVSEALGKLFSAKQIVKVGYQVSSDLVRVAASYPHLACFQEEVTIWSVLELDGLVKRTLQLLKQKKSRAITTSLAKLTAHYLHKSINKDCQVSNWSARPLTREQLNYAALDAAIGPVLAEAAFKSIQATTIMHTETTRMTMVIPRIERWEGDDGFRKVLVNWRFTHFGGKEHKTEHEKVQLQKYKASQVLGQSSSSCCWTVSQNWIVGKPEPPVPKLSSSPS